MIDTFFKNIVSLIALMNRCSHQMTKKKQNTYSAAAQEKQIKVKFIR